MDCITWDELRALGFVLVAFLLFSLTQCHSILLGLNTEVLLQYFNKWGSNARTCLTLAKEPSQEVTFIAAAQQAARFFASSPIHFTVDVKAVSHCASHSIFTIVPSPDRMSETVEIKTKFLHDLIANAIAEADSAKQVDFYFLTSGHPWFRQSSGYVFQKFVITWLFSNPESEGLQCTPTDPENSEPFSLHAVGETLFMFDGEGALLKAKDYGTSGWLPAAPNYPSFDVIIFTPERIITVQATIASRHDAKLQGFNQVEKVIKPYSHYRQDQTWCHIFLTHHDENAQRLRTQAFPDLNEKSICIYSAVLNPAQLGITADTVKDAQTRRVSGCQFYPCWPS